PLGDLGAGLDSLGQTLGIQRPFEIGGPLRLRLGVAGENEHRHELPQAPVEWKPPSTWTISPVVAGNQSESRATMALPAGVASVWSQPRGARSLHMSSRVPKPGIEVAAVVLSGPAETRLTRTPSSPKYWARQRAVQSKAALATAIQS